MRAIKPADNPPMGDASQRDDHPPETGTGLEDEPARFFKGGRCAHRDADGERSPAAKRHTFAAAGYDSFQDGGDSVQIQSDCFGGLHR